MIENQNNQWHFSKLIQTLNYRNFSFLLHREKCYYLFVPVGVFVGCGRQRVEKIIKIWQVYLLVEKSSFDEFLEKEFDVTQFSVFDA
jgi:hypothetical protein